MSSSRVILARFILLCFLFASVADVLAKRPGSKPGGDNGCLNNKELTQLAKQALPELQAIDPTVALKDIKTVIKTVGDCATTDAVYIVLEAYANELRADNQPINNPPSISGFPNTSVAEGELYDFTPTASDPDGDSLTFSISNKPGWSSFNTSTGRLFGTPVSSYAGQIFSTIVISANDGADTVSLPAFAIEVNSNASDEVPTVLLTVDSNSIAYNASTTLTWSSTDVTSCTASGGWSGDKTTAGSQSSGVLTSDTIFALTCSGAGGTASESVTVSVLAPPAPTMTLSASPSQVAYNATTNLNWTTNNADSCAASGGWSGAKGTSGIETSSVLSADTTFTLNCVGVGGNTSKSVAVSVSAPPVPTVTLSASPSQVAYNTATTLNWASSNTESCTASGGWSGSKGLSGSLSSQALISDTTFALTCSGPGGSVSESVTVSVSAPIAPTLTLSASPAQIAYNAATTLNWTTSNADSCIASDGWSGDMGTSGSLSSGALTEDTTFVLSCTGTGGTVSDSVTVAIQTITSSATLTWTPPTTNEDGSVLDDLAGYKVYRGTSSGNYSTTIVLNNPGISTYVIDDLSPGTYHFAVTAFDTTGNESNFSPEASKTIN